MVKQLTVLILISLFANFLYAQKIIEHDLHCNSKNKNALIAYSYGTEAFKKGDYKTAITYLDKAVRIDSLFCDAWNNLGLAFRYAGNWKNGYWTLIRAIMIDTTYYVSWLNMSEHMMLAKDTTNAIKSIRNLLRNSPNDYHGISALAKLYYTIAQYDSSMKYVNIALNMKQEQDIRFTKCYDFFELKKYDDFKILGDSLILVDKKDGLLNYYFGKYYEMKNDTKLARKHLKIAEKQRIKRQD